MSFELFENITLSQFGRHRISHLWPSSSKTLISFLVCWSVFCDNLHVIVFLEYLL